MASLSNKGSKKSLNPLLPSSALSSLCQNAGWSLADFPGISWNVPVFHNFTIFDCFMVTELKRKHFINKNRLNFVCYDS